MLIEFLRPYLGNLTYRSRALLNLLILTTAYTNLCPIKLSPKLLPLSELTLSIDALYS